MRHSDQLKSLCESAKKYFGPTGKLLEPLYKGFKRGQGKGFATGCGKE